MWTKAGTRVKAPDTEKRGNPTKSLQTGPTARAEMHRDPSPANRTSHKVTESQSHKLRSSSASFSPPPRVGSQALSAMHSVRTPTACGQRPVRHYLTRARLLDSEFATLPKRGYLNRFTGCQGWSTQLQRTLPLPFMSTDGLRTEAYTWPAEFMYTTKGGKVS